MRFRPCIDLHNGRVKQIVGGSLSDGPNTPVENYLSPEDSAYYARLYQQDGLTGGHVIMLGPGNEQEALKALSTYPGGLQIGGGITAENAHRYLDAGASHVIVTSYVFRDGYVDYGRLEKMVTIVGKKKIVLDLSCRAQGDAYFVVTNRWQTFTTCQISATSLNQLSAYCDEFLIHAVDVEGRCGGIERELVQQLGEWVSIPTTYAGGVTTWDDLQSVKELGKDNLDVTIGSALDIFGGTLPYSDVVRQFGRGD